MDPVAFFHHFPNVTEAAVVDGALDYYSGHAAEHDDDLEDVRPHDCLHAALEREEFRCHIDAKWTSVVLICLFSCGLSKTHLHTISDGKSRYNRSDTVNTIVLFSNCD